MGWFLWGVAIGWGSCALYFYNLHGTDQEKVTNATWIIFLTLCFVAVLISIGLGVQGEAFQSTPPTPTSLGR